MSRRKLLDRNLERLPFVGWDVRAQRNGFRLEGAVIDPCLLLPPEFRFSSPDGSTWLRPLTCSFHKTPAEVTDVMLLERSLPRRPRWGAMSSRLPLLTFIHCKTAVLRIIIYILPFNLMQHFEFPAKCVLSTEVDSRWIQKFACLSLSINLIEWTDMSLNLTLMLMHASWIKSKYSYQVCDIHRISGRMVDFNPVSSGDSKSNQRVYCCLKNILLKIFRSGW